MVLSFHPAQVSHSIDEGFIKSSSLEELMVISSEPVDLVDKLCLRAQDSCEDQNPQSWHSTDVNNIACSVQLLVMSFYDVITK